MVSRFFGSLRMTLLLGIIVILYSCNNNSSKSTSQDAKFESFSKHFIDEFWKLNPDWALRIGNHTYDDKMEIPSAQNRADKLKQYKIWLDSLKGFNEKELSPSNLIDLKLIRNQLEYYNWQVNEFKSYEWNPAEYNVGEGFDLVLSNSKLPLNDRLKAISKRLESVPEYFIAAKQNINKPTHEHLELAIQQNKGSLSIFQQEISDSLKASKLPKGEKEKLKALLNTAVNAINGYVHDISMLLETQETDRFRSFRIGKELYDKKFDFEIQSQYTAEEVYKKAQERKTYVQGEMLRLTKNLWPKYFPNTKMPDGNAAVRQMINKLSLHHCNRDSFLQTIQKQLPQLVDFIKQKNLIYIDPSKPLVVRVTPAYKEGGGAGASIDDPGPYDKDGRTYYNVSLLGKYSPEQAESFLREYNDYILQILNIHEAIPGHYTQLVYANQSPSLIKSAFGNSAMIEGWAVYGERMMLEQGYGGGTDEMWLMYYKWHLRSVLNTILDYSIQCLNMSEKDAKGLMMNEGFQQQAEADGKWKRATLTQVQICCYFTGYTELYQLREDIKKKEGNNFVLKKFHEKFLSYGSAPVKYIREMMEQPHQTSP